MAAHSSTLAWKILWMDKSRGLPWWLSSKESAAEDSLPEEENGNPIQYSSLEKSMDRRGVAKELDTT